jgi:hypothetical protein
VTGELLSGVTLEVVSGGRYVIKPPSMSVENSDVFWRVAEASKLQLISFQEDCYVQETDILVIVVGLWADGLGPGKNGYLGLGQ